MSFFNEKEQKEILEGEVDKIIYSNEDNGYVILSVYVPSMGENFTVTSSMPDVLETLSYRFFGEWTFHKVYGKQFKATSSIHLKPQTNRDLESFIGSGLITGIGSKLANAIVSTFKNEDVIDIFDNHPEKLLAIPGIKDAKLKTIKESWAKHSEMRDTMIFLQKYNISPSFAVRIYKHYQERTIEIVSDNPYRMARDIQGVGFLSADKVALKMGIPKDSPKRIVEAISYCLEQFSKNGHCYSTKEDIINNVKKLVNFYDEEKIVENIDRGCEDSLIKKVDIGEIVYTSNRIYFAEKTIAKKIRELSNYNSRLVESDNWFEFYQTSGNVSLSDEQRDAVDKILKSKFSILTGGPGCGKTTTTQAIVFHLKRVGAKVLLAAPTGRAAQRMGEVIGFEAQTIHRLLEFSPNNGGFTRNSDNPLEADFIIIDEASMLDIHLASSLLKATNRNSQILFIGDPDQLPSVGAGNVLKDLINDSEVNSFRLTKIFRQAEQSSIIKFAHSINNGKIPKIISPLAYPGAFKQGIDCLFLDSDQATKEQINLIRRLNKAVVETKSGYKTEDEFKEAIKSGEIEKNIDFKLPEKFKDANLSNLIQSNTSNDRLRTLVKKVHPWSSLNYGKTADEVIDFFYSKKIGDLIGKDASIQILSPQKRGSLGTNVLNSRIQNLVNSPNPEKKEIKIGETIFREKDRVIQTKNNYDLEVFNGDIGEVFLIEKDAFIVDFGKNGVQNLVIYKREDVLDLALAYAITIHKSQGSEFDAVIIPVFEQHYNMLYRNLIYTGLTRAKKLAIFVGTRKALAMAIGNNKSLERKTLLPYFLKERTDGS